MQIRLFRPSDLQSLYEIDQSCFPPGVSYSLRELSGFIRRRHSRTWVAHDGEEIVGFVIAEQHPWMHMGHIITLDVVESWRRRHVGSALMDVAEDWARRRGFLLVSLETAEDNNVAQAFYEKRGYVKYERLENYYASGQAAWIMVKWLK